MSAEYIMAGGNERVILCERGVRTFETATRNTLDLSAVPVLHELTHLRRRDIWRKALSLWVTALYWFDPLVWLMGRAMERDGELACDEAALKRLPPEARAAYGRAVWEAVERVSRPD